MAALAHSLPLCPLKLCRAAHSSGLSLGFQPAPAAMAPPSKPAAANGAGQEEAEASPVLAAVAKRMRNLRKRLRNAEEIQAKRDAGKELNPDQVGASRRCWTSGQHCTANWAARWRRRRAPGARMPWSAAGTASRAPAPP